MIGSVSAGSSVLNVDSTVGFAKTGELFVTYNDTTTGVVTYTSKSLNQFFGCTNVTGIMEDAATIGINTFPYAPYNGENIQVRINSLLAIFLIQMIP